MNDLATAENRGIEAADYANGKGTPIRARSRSRGTTDVRVSRFEVTFYLIFGHFAPRSPFGKYGFNRSYPVPASMQRRNPTRTPSRSPRPPSGGAFEDEEENAGIRIIEGI